MDMTIMGLARLEADSSHSLSKPNQRHPMMRERLRTEYLAACGSFKTLIRKKKEESWNNFIRERNYGLILGACRINWQQVKPDAARGSIKSLRKGKMVPLHYSLEETATEIVINLIISDNLSVINIGQRIRATNTEDQDAAITFKQNSTRRNSKFGFVAGKSSTDVFSRVVEDARREMAARAASTVGAVAENKYRTAAFFDIKAVFENVWWPTIFGSLKDKNISTKLIKIIKNYN